MTLVVDSGDIAFVAYCLTVSPVTPIESIKPLKSVEWVKLTSHLANSDVQPTDLLAQSGAERAAALDGADLDLNRINTLLDRSGQVAIEIQHWSDSGIWICTRNDGHYPAQLIHHLGDTAPPLLFGVGEPHLAVQDGVAIVGSRNVDEAGTQFAIECARALARSGKCIVSGGARGVDRTAMIAAMTVGGTSVGVMSDNLARTLREAEVRSFLSDEQLLLMSPYRPDAGFHVGTAMGRNKLIYCLSTAAVVVATEVDGNGKGKGGTWAGATENLKHGWVPLFVWSHECSSVGNRALLKWVDPSGRRATPMPSVPADGQLPEPSEATELPEKAAATQLTMPGSA